MGIEKDVCVTGGVAKNRAVVQALERIIGTKVRDLGIDPQIVGALGAALFAKNRYARLKAGEDTA